MQLCPLSICPYVHILLHVIQGHATNTRVAASFLEISSTVCGISLSDERNALRNHHKQGDSEANMSNVIVSAVCWWLSTGAVITYSFLIYAELVLEGLVMITKCNHIGCYCYYMDGSVQDCSISIAYALEILQSCIKSLIWSGRMWYQYLNGPPIERVFLKWENGIYGWFQTEWQCSFYHKYWIKITWGQ